MGEAAFVVDAMLGKLVKWLRILGCDVLSVSEVGNIDENLLEVARSEDRILITGDQSLFQMAWKRGLRVRYITGTNVTDALALLSKAESVPLRIDLSKTRCPDCNAKLIELPSDKVSGVPKDVLRKHLWIYLCENCNKTYWLGSHYLKMLRTLIEAKRKRDGKVNHLNSGKPEKSGPMKISDGFDS
ncbi:MAG: hypothetical protein DRN90_03470 [Thermoproteota archaeon]|nr:MAG: hypothetical protein DRN92_04040 [Candidatus Korarchaeota archaeon]RLG48492.1 MAG: hypothetical protein DRN90_03470 [Candidatus Korarchaeota archaeon]